MNIHRKTGGVLLAGAALALAAPAFAANDFNTSPPQPQQEGNVTYITGGIGADEATALRSEAKDYNLLISDANRQGQFTADNNFTIEGRDGREMISVNNAGPLFYAKLPPGEYTVTATHNGQQETRTVKISGGHEDHLHLVW